MNRYVCDRTGERKQPEDFVRKEAQKALQKAYPSAKIYFESCKAMLPSGTRLQMRVLMRIKQSRSASREVFVDVYYELDEADRKFRFISAVVETIKDSYRNPSAPMFMAPASS